MFRQRILQRDIMKVLEKHLMTAAELEQVLDPYAMTEATEDMKQAM